jgi:hypothetical protein
MNVTGITVYTEGNFVYVELLVDDKCVVSMHRQDMRMHFYEHTTEAGLMALPDRDTYRASLPKHSDDRTDASGSTPSA